MTFEGPASQLRIALPRPIASCDTLVVRPYVMADVPALVAGVEESLTELRQFMPFAHFPQSVEIQKKRIAGELSAYWKGEDATMGMFGEPGNIFFGSTGMHHRTLSTLGREIGYWVTTQYAGQGIATLTTQALIAYCFAYLGLTRIQCGHVDNNLGSAKVNDKCGFRIEATLRNFTPQGTPEMIKNGWKASDVLIMRGLLPEHVPALSWYQDVLRRLEVYDWLGRKARPTVQSI